MIELHIPQPGEESQQAKDLIFFVLSKHQPLSLIAITNQIQKHYHVGLTYQAIRKAVTQLVQKNVLIKSGKQYVISKDWLLRVKTTIDKLLAQYETGSQIHAFSEELVKENYAMYTFHNLLDLDMFWGDVMLHWAHTLKSQDSKECHFYADYTWWMLINLGREMKIFQDFSHKQIPTELTLFTNTPLNRWAGSIYQKVGTKVRFSKINHDSSIAINILGDLVIQVKYSQDILRHIQNIFEKYSSIEQVSPKEITELVHYPCELKFSVFKNTLVAKSITESFSKK